MPKSIPGQVSALDVATVPRRDDRGPLSGAKRDWFGAGCGRGVARAFLTDPSLGGDFAAARNSWLPALVNLLDGMGSTIFTVAMQSAPAVFLDNVPAAAAGDLVSQLADLRLNAVLDNLAGAAVCTAPEGFTTLGEIPTEGTSQSVLNGRYR